MNLSLRVPPHTTEEMADKYLAAPNDLPSISLWELKAFRQMVNLQFSYLSKLMYFDFVDYEPYGENPTIDDVLKDFRAGTIKIHTTGNDSPVWGKFTNLQFRAVHDYIHCAHELEFNHASECIAFQKQMEFSFWSKFAEEIPYLNWDMYKRILRSEIIYQSAYKEAKGAFHIDQKIILADL
jgi:hypothetical protein